MTKPKTSAPAAELDHLDDDDHDPTPATTTAAGPAAAAIAAKKAEAQAKAKPKYEHANRAKRGGESDETRRPKTFSREPGDFVFIGDPQDARRGPLMEIDYESGEEVEPPLIINDHEFPRKEARHVDDPVLCAKLRGNNHFMELKDGQTLEQLLESLPRASRERRANISIARLGVPSERRGKQTRAERDTARLEDEV